MGQTDKSDDKRGLRLLLGALPEIIRFHIIVGILIVGLGWVIDQLIDGVVLAGGGAITTANLAKSLMNWRTPVLLVLIAALAVLFVAMTMLPKSWAPVLRIAVNTVLILLFTAVIVKKDLIRFIRRRK